MKLRRPLYGPQDPRGPSHGRDVLIVKRSLARVEESFFPRPAAGFTDVYNAKTSDAVAIFQRINDIPASGNFGQATLDALEPYMTAVDRWRYRTFRAPDPVPSLGPVWKGGQSVLDHDLTHATSGIPLFPAFDDAFVEGREIIAPEAIAVIPNPRTGALWTSSNPGHAFYAQGASKLRFWFGHLDRNHAVGVKFAKGALVGRVAPNSIGGGPHTHVGVNVELLLGAGRELEHRTDYRHGASTVREQLQRALA